MKRFVAVFLCAVMMAFMIPSFFASANSLPTQQEAVVVAADDSSSDSGQVDNTLVGLPEALMKFVELWGGLLKTIVGSKVWEGFLPALKQVLSVVSLSEFFKTIAQIWKDVRS